MNNIPLINLPQDYSRPPAPGYQREEVNITIKAAQLDKLGIESTFYCFLASISILLNRYSGQQYIPIFFYAHGLTRLGNSKGLKIAEIKNGLTVSDLITQIKEKPTVNISNSQYSQVATIILSDTESNPDIPLADIKSWIMNHDLVWLLEIHNNTVNIRCNFDAELFTFKTVQYMTRYLQTLFIRVLSQDATSVTTLPLSPTPQCEDISLAKKGLHHSSFNFESVDRMFETQVKLRPDAIAASDDKQQVTYNELNQRANQLAHYLQSKGYVSGDLLAVYMERSVNLLITILGIIKSGACYLPIDPGYPDARIQYILKDARVTAIVTEDALSVSLIKNTVPIINTNSVRLDKYSKTTPDIKLIESSPVYVIYTSGSTGKPKGIKVSHKSLSNLLQSMADQPGLTPSDSLVAVTTIAFDIAAMELFLPLVTGAMVVIAGQNISHDPGRLSLLIHQSRANCMQATPVTWELLLESGWTPPTHFKCLCGGESLSMSLASSLLDHEISLWNLYGPSETTIWSSIKQITASDLNTPGSSMSIGAPIENTQFYILDEHQQIQPFGIPGELYIGGYGLAINYHHQPQMTCEKFVGVTLLPGMAERLFRTGDRVRQLSNETFLFLGRMDNQIKLRGFRVELGEIESLLEQYPCVSKAAVQLENHMESAQLHAYLVVTNDKCEIQSIRSYLAALLPSYMLPTSYHNLETMPLTPNGKVNRAALSQATTKSWKESPATRQETSESQRVILGIWRELLNTQHISIYDNFFDLGGHSLLLSQVYERLLLAFPGKLSLTDLYKYPTILALSSWLDGQHESTDKMNSGNLRGKKRRNRLMRKKQLKDRAGHDQA